MTTTMGAIKRGWDRIQSAITGRRSWQTLEYFDESWKRRIEEMASYVDSGESVIDLGCGKMWLRSFLKGNIYHGVDYTQRDPNTIVADFNRYQYPDIEADVAFISGALEYVEDYDWFIHQVSTHSRKCIVSYCTTEQFPAVRMRRQKAWKNHLSRSALLEVFEKNEMRLDRESTAIAQNPIFIFSKRESW